MATYAGHSPEGLSMVNQSAMVRLTARNLSAGWKIVLVTRVSARDQWRFESAIARGGRSTCTRLANARRCDRTTIMY